MIEKEKLIGLSDEQVLSSREQYGSNEIPDSEPTTFWAEFKETFNDPMIRILLVIAGIMIAMFFFGYAEIYEPLGTILAVFIVAFVTAKTGVSSDTKYRELKASTEKDKSKAYRNGSVSVIDMDDVVVGDYILLQAGDKIPADGVLVQGFLKVDNSALNGEAEECPKSPSDDSYVFPKEITGDTFVDEHSLFRGAIVTDGEGILLIKKVGLKTMMGKMAEEMNEEEPDSPLKVKLNKLANQISMFGYIGAVVIALCYMGFFIIRAGGFTPYFSLGAKVIIQNLIEAVTLAITIVICAVPEGLPLTISLTLMSNTGKLLDHNVLVRKAIGIETAGSLNILFSDKTGTITKGKLEVVEFFGGTAETMKEIPLTVKDQLELSICKNTNALFDENHQVIGGNMTDKALLHWIGENRYNRRNEVITESQAFNSKNKFSQSYLKSEKKTFYKGAPERLLTQAKYYLDENGKEQPISLEAINQKIDELAQKSMRILAFGYSKKKLVEDKIHDDLVIIGFVAIRDDVRPEARDAIKQVQDAGIQVVMVTGDRLETARAIAKDAGLITKESDVCLTSKELSSLSDEEVKSILPNLRVVARALPTDKSRLVRICQSMNLVTGMTGDGVNDSPALKLADVGFAMGSGTEAAKESGDLIILDDNFRSIKDAIWFGRTIYHNILKFCKFQLAINVAAVFVSMLAPFFGVDAPLKVTHLLFVNLVMDSLGSLMLGMEPELPEYMHEKPKRRDESIISKAMAIQIGFAGIWFILISFLYLKHPFFIRLFANEEQHLTGYFVLFILLALFNGFNVRDDGFGIFKNLNGNKNFLRIMFAIMAIQFCIVNVGLIPNVVAKSIGEMFSCVPFGIQGWIAVILLAITIIPVDLLRKCFVKK